jgi:hypothetical protein
MSFSLLSYVEATDSMLVIDAADLNRAPGDHRAVRRCGHGRFLKSARRRTVHEVGLIDLLDMARLRCLPARRALLCIQPGRIDWGETLSSSGCGGAARGGTGRHPELLRTLGLQCESPQRYPDSIEPPPTFGVGGGVAAILSELVTLLERLAHGGGVCHHRLAQPPDECPRTARNCGLLGEGEVRATHRRRRSCQPSARRRVPGVWWVEHRDRQGELMAELIEVTRRCRKF